jgi:hypothetical protein
MLEPFKHTNGNMGNDFIKPVRHWLVPYYTKSPEMLVSGLLLTGGSICCARLMRFENKWKLSYHQGK